MTSSARKKTVLFFVVLTVSNLSADAAELKMRANIQAPGSIILLGDVAEIHATDSEQLAALRRLELFPAPGNNRSRVLRQREVRELLLLNGFDVANLTISGAEAARIRARDTTATRASQRTTEPARPSIVVTRRALKRGDTLRTTDVELRAVDSIPRKVSPVFKLEDIIGLEVTRGIPADYAIDARYVQRPILIRRGEPVTVFALATGVRVRTTAKSVGQGSMGDLIMLESLENRQRFSARITGVQRAEVFASGVRVTDAGWPEKGNRRVAGSR